jgi:hypothetical protein
MSDSGNKDSGSKRSGCGMLFVGLVIILYMGPCFILSKNENATSSLIIIWAVVTVIVVIAFKRSGDL